MPNPNLTSQVSINFYELFSDKSSDALTSLLMEKLKILKPYTKVIVILPRGIWHKYVLRKNNSINIKEKFNYLVIPRLRLFFGQANIELMFSHYNQDDDANIIWGEGYSCSGKYSLFIQNQKVASFDNYCIVDSQLISGFGICHSTKFELLVKDGEIELLKGHDDYSVNGLSLIASESTNSLHFSLRKDT
ncbi:hypothetical protein [Thalassotalea castellviae]|uniref:Uncharacterized protein n=1 Tax=Thalassotalea castellviae TaxID=3075612 RepID=A0ABU3A449_9GAMM|nr:hypothetical protein [Thalassotalea sp. W431]MDT0604322.1 hypothetical protein [Thalassotalea sp. W431]